MTQFYEEKRTKLGEPVVTAGDRVYSISSQNGLFPDPWGGNVPHEVWGVWDHPIKLLDGFWFGLRLPNGVLTWLSEADACRVYPGYTEFEYSPNGLRVVRRDFSPDGIEGLVIKLSIEAPRYYSGSAEVVAVFRSDLQPSWYGDRPGPENGQDNATLLLSGGDLLFNDSDNPWTALVGASPDPQELLQGDQLPAPQPTFGKGATAGMVLKLEANTEGTAEVYFFIAGSSDSADAAAVTLAKLRAEHEALFKSKTDFYGSLVSENELKSPEPALDRAFAWAKLDSQMLAREVPGLGRGAGAGLPQYPWWFGVDVEYAILPLLHAGLFDLARDSLRLLKSASLKENPDEVGRIIHELLSTGIVYNPGNMVETPLFLRAVHQTWLWSGDRAFLDEMYEFCKTALLDYALGKEGDPDGDLCPSGRSIIETLEMHSGVECIDPATYTWEALLRLSDMARVVGDEVIIPDLLAKADELGRRIREEWWLADEGLFADVRASVAEVLARLDEVDRVAAASPHEDQRRQARDARAMFEPQIKARADGPQDVDMHWLLRHWVIMCPVEVGLATPEQAIRLLDRLESPEFTGEWGMYLHPNRHSVMTINTGVLAMAEGRYGRMDQALRYVRNLVDSIPYYMPGAISEALPDQWCFIQLWSALGVLSPVVEAFLGVEPDAGKKTLRVVPQLPTTWDHASLNQLKVGDDHFDINVQFGETERTVEVSGPDDYTLHIGAHVPGDAQIGDVLLDGAKAEWREETTTAGRRVVVEAKGSAKLVVQFS